MLNNPWTLRLITEYRFHPRVDTKTGIVWIEDTQHPERHDWQTHLGSSFNDSSVDYAIVFRVHDASTGTSTLILGGLGLHGTQAAAEFVTETNNLDLIAGELRHPEKDHQVVLKTTVINGKTGPPQVVAVAQ